MKCPSCGDDTIAADAYACPRCGLAFGERQDKQCPYCAETIRAAAIVCKHCHRDIPVAAGDQPPQPSVVIDKKGGREVLAAVVIIGIIGAGLLMVMGSSSSVPRQAAADEPFIPSSFGVNAAHDRIASLTQSRRNTTFASISSGECSVIDHVHLGVAADGNSWWRLECGGDKKLLLSIQPDEKGSTRVLDCALANVLKIDCYAWMGAKPR